MHSRIFCLRDIDKDSEDILETDIEDWFVDKYADYIQKINYSDWHSNLQWLCEVYGDFVNLFYENDETVLEFNPDGCKSHLQEQYDDMLDLVKSFTFEDFKEMYGGKKYQLELLLNERSGFWFIINGEDLYNVDDLARKILIDNKTKYKVESVFDYHM